MWHLLVQHLAHAQIFAVGISKQAPRCRHQLSAAELLRLLQRNAPHFKEAIVDEQQSSRWVTRVVREHAVGGGIEGAPQILQAIGERQPGRLLLGDIAGHGYDAAIPRLSRPEWRKRRFSEPVRRANQLHLGPQNLWCSSGQALQEGHGTLGRAQGRNHVAARPPDNLLTRQPECPAPGVVDQQVVGFAVQQADHVTDRVDDEFRRAQRLTGLVNDGEVREHAHQPHVVALNIGDGRHIHEAVHHAAVRARQRQIQAPRPGPERAGQALAQRQGVCVVKE